MGVLSWQGQFTGSSILLSHDQCIWNQHHVCMYIVCTLYVHAEWSLRYGVDFWSGVIEKKIYCNIYFFFVSMQGDKIYLFLWPVCWQSFNAKIIFLWVSWYIFQQLVYQEQIFLSQVHFNHIRCTFYSDWATFNILS